MYTNVARAARNSDKQIATCIANGFTGILKGWWDNCLTIQQRIEMLDTIKIENDVQKPDAIYTLMLNILEHFTGGIFDEGERTRTVLQNLRCPTLTHFRW